MKNKFDELTDREKEVYISAFHLGVNADDDLKKEFAKMEWKWLGDNHKFKGA